MSFGRSGNLGYTRYLTARDMVHADLSATLQAFQLEVVEHQVESLFIFGDMAVELTRFAVKNTIDAGAVAQCKFHDCPHHERQGDVMVSAFVRCRIRRGILAPSP